MTFLLGEQIKSFYGNGAVPCPSRHYYNRFVRDMRTWSEKYVDYMHYTVPLKSGVAAGYEFPADYVGQYGAWEAVKHIYTNSHLKDLLSKDGDELYISKRYFATESEKAIQNIREQWRQK